jgi:hypothetical protein
MFFIFPLFATFALFKIKSNIYLYLAVIICCLPGLIFFTQYFQPDIRHLTSVWIDNNIPENSIILSEAGNVVNLPITSKNYQVNNFDFYGLDDNQSLQTGLPEQVFKTDYIIIPSRRIFKNQQNNLFPSSQNYYHHLFDGSLGFIEIKKFIPSTDLWLNSENAEETWTVFDRPTIRIYKKINQLDLSQYETLLKS